MIVLQMGVCSLLLFQIAWAIANGSDDDGPDGMA